MVSQASSDGQNDSGNGYYHPYNTGDNGWMVNTGNTPGTISATR
jgi:spermidine/putrescine-binding protein